jgi:hypothetical protein
MKRILVKIVLPVSLLAVWMITCYPICRKAEGFDFFLYWVLVGCPYGIRKMCMILIPKNFGIAGSIGILALMLHSLVFHGISFRLLTWQNVLTLNVGIHHDNRSFIVCIIADYHRHILFSCPF